MTDSTGNGYWVVSYAGNVQAFGDAINYGGAAKYLNGGNGEVISAASTTSGHGYWILLLNGAVYTFGDAGYFGGPSGQILFSNPASAIFSTPDGGGYWVTATSGAVYAYGDAPYYGGVSTLHLNGPIVAATGS
jgi:hypothetical protein